MLNIVLKANEQVQMLEKKTSNWKTSPGNWLPVKLAWWPHVAVTGQAINSCSRSLKLDTQNYCFQ